jgi:hypothetical protein
MISWRLNMRRLLVVGMLVIAFSSAWGDPRFGDFWMSRSKLEQNMATFGWLSAMTLIRRMSPGSITSSIDNILDNVHPDDMELLVDAITEYLKSNPDRWDDQPWVTIGMAYMIVIPEKQRRSR